MRLFIRRVVYRSAAMPFIAAGSVGFYLMLASLGTLTVLSRREARRR